MQWDRLVELTYVLTIEDPGRCANVEKHDERGSSLRESGSHAFLDSRQPRELRVQDRDGVGRTRGKWIDCGYGVWLRLALKLETHAAVAPLRFTAARPNAPQLLGGLIK
jgi:hypothetical protein